MAGLSNIQVSDAVFSDEEKMVEAVVSLLQFRYIRSQVCPSTQARQDTAVRPGGRSLLKYAYRPLPHSLGYPSWSGEVELICMTSMSENIFWDYVAEALVLDPDTMPKPEDGGVAIRLSDVRTLGAIPGHLSKLRICYTQQNWTVFDTAPKMKKNLDMKKDRPLARSYDTQAISETVASLTKELSSREEQQWHKQLETENRDDQYRQVLTDLFRSGFLQLRHWALCMGILNSEFHLFSDEMLLLLYIDALSKVVETEDIHLETTTVLPAVMSRQEFLHPRKMLCSHGGRLAANAPSHFPIEPISSEATRAFTQSLKTVDYSRMPVKEWATTGRTAFVDSHESFLAFHSRCWIPKMRSEIMDTLPETLVNLQAHIRKSERRVLVSIWPYSVSNLQDRQEGEHIYILGVYSFNEQEPVDQENLEILYQGFLDKLRYDHTSFSLSCAPMPRDEVISLLQNSNALQESMSVSPTSPSIAASFQSISLESNKFRTASSAMNRLRWDPKHAALQYEVGYIDRFEKDLMWKSLDKWEKMTEEEEFIPEHRIRKIRRKASGTVVWDRERRVDGT